MRSSGNEPSSVILSQTKLFQKLKRLLESAKTKLKPNIHDIDDLHFDKIYTVCVLWCKD